MKKSTLSEQLQIPIEKSENEDKSVRDRSIFWLGTGTSIKK